MRLIDINEEHSVSRWGCGVKVGPFPKKVTQKIKSSSMAYQTVRDVISLPFNTYFMNTESKMLKVSASVVVALGCDSSHDVFGRSVFDFSPKKMH